MKVSAPSGWSAAWRLYRHCCCRYGWYPIAVLPIVTIGSFLSLYTSAGCELVHVDIGFEPVNDGWNSSIGEFGLLFHQTGITHDNNYRDQFHHGCEWYTPEFTYHFVDADRTWKMARVMAIISMCSSVIAAIFVLLFVISPIPISFFWPGVVLPAVLVSFIAEGSKFLIFDTAMCRNNIWDSDEGQYISSHRAEDCTMGHTAYVAIVAVIVHFISLCFVCLKAPERRNLVEDYGISGLSPKNQQRKDFDIEDGSNSMGGGSLRSTGSYRNARHSRGIRAKHLHGRFRPDSPPPGRKRNRDRAFIKGIGFLDEVSLETSNSMNTATTGIQEDNDEGPFNSGEQGKTEAEIQNNKELAKKALGVSTDLFGMDKTAIEVSPINDAETGEGNLLVRTFSGMLATKSLSEYLLPSPISSCISNEAACDTAANTTDKPASPTKSIASTLPTSGAEANTGSNDGISTNIVTSDDANTNTIIHTTEYISTKVDTRTDSNKFDLLDVNGAVASPTDAVVSPTNTVASVAAATLSCASDNVDAVASVAADNVCCASDPVGTTAKNDGAQFTALLVSPTSDPVGTSATKDGAQFTALTVYKEALEAAKKQEKKEPVDKKTENNEKLELSKPSYAGFCDDSNVGICNPQHDSDSSWIPRTMSC